MDAFRADERCLIGEHRDQVWQHAVSVDGVLAPISELG